MNPGTPAARPAPTAAAARYAPVVQTLGQSASTPARSKSGAPTPKAIGKAMSMGWIGWPLMCAVLRMGVFLGSGAGHGIARAGRPGWLVDRRPGARRRLRFGRLGHRRPGRRGRVGIDAGG